MPETAHLGSSGAGTAAGSGRGPAWRGSEGCAPQAPSPPARPGDGPGRTRPRERGSRAALPSRAALDSRTGHLGGRSAAAGPLAGRAAQRLPSSALRGTVTLGESEPHVGEQLQALSVCALRRRRPVAAGPAFCPQEAAVCPCSQWACMQRVPAPRAARPRSSPTSQMRGRRRGRPKALARGPTSGTALGSLARSCAPSCPACLSPVGSPSLSRGQMRLACV